ncbi:MAG: hypothetical protein K2J07_02450, partial [Muribaculaceae bacterium]|nr:hypothetical protein [Muribaculaceae bacterium]
MIRTQSPVWRLLKRNISAGQILGYALANFVGLAIVLTAVQFYTDVKAAYSTADSSLGRDYLVISREIKGIGSRPNFTNRELEEIREQPWVESVGEFTASRFESVIKVNLAPGAVGNTGFSMPSRGISTAAFFESLPDRFFDKLPEGWDWEPNPYGGPQPRVPIVLSKDYLTLFNFGFAASYGFPTVSERTVSAVPLSLIIIDGAQRIYLEAYIAGFSSRINTIAVPESFMTWANDRYASGAPVKGPSRLILEVSDPGNPEIKAFMEENSYEVAGDKMSSSDSAYFLRLITGIVIGVGVLISILAFFILMLSIFLLVQKSREKLRDLILLGYTPGSVAGYYYRLVATVNLLVVALAVVAVFAVRHFWSNGIESVSAEEGSVMPMLLIACGVLVALTLSNV